MRFNYLKYRHELITNTCITTQCRALLGFIALEWRTVVSGSFNIDLTVKTGCHIPFQTCYSQVVVTVSLKTKPLQYPFDPTVNIDDKNVPLNLKGLTKDVFTRSYQL